MTHDFNPFMIVGTYSEPKNQLPVQRDVIFVENARSGSAFDEYGSRVSLPGYVSLSLILAEQSTEFSSVFYLL